MSGFQDTLKRHVRQAEMILHQDTLVADVPQARLIEAMAYSLAAGGKRIRPVLVLAVGELLDLPECAVSPFAHALELIHTYSLIHDDLPAMDNDALRRGRPTNHMVFGEAMAILAGDALLNRAYEVMLEALAEWPAEGGIPLENAVRAARLVSEAAGASGMVGGQVLDMEAEAAVAELAEKPEKEVLDRIERMHALKTGALIRACVEVPATLRGLEEDRFRALSTYAGQLGLAFQIRDDLLDLLGTEAELGKPIGSDARNGKHTYVSLLGAEGAQNALARATRAAGEALLPFGGRAAFLTELARFVAERTH